MASVFQRGFIPALQAAEVEGWLKLKAASDATGMGQNTLRNLVDRGAAAGKTWMGEPYIDPESLPSSPEIPITMQLAEVVSVVTAFQKQLTAHNEKLYEMGTAAHLRVQQMQAAMLDKADARIASLETRLAQMLDDVEKARTQEHQRVLEERAQQARIDLDRRELETKEKNWEKALAMGQANLPAFMALIGAKYQPENTSLVGNAVERLLETLSTDQLSTLQRTLNPSQLTALLAIRDAQQTRKGASVKSDSQASRPSTDSMGQGSAPSTQTTTRPADPSTDSMGQGSQLSSAANDNAPALDMNAIQTQLERLKSAADESQALAEKAMAVAGPVLKILLGLPEDRRMALLSSLPAAEAAELVQGLQSWTK